MIRAALDGALDDVPFETDPIFGLSVPTVLPRTCRRKLLNPRSTWADKAAYDAQARKLAGMFAENFREFADSVSPEVRASGLREGIPGSSGRSWTGSRASVRRPIVRAMPEPKGMGGEMAESLWESDDEARWRDALDLYPAVVEWQSEDGLPELDRWYRESLPARLASRQQKFLDMDELVQVVRWKMKRGEWRARNLALVESNDPAFVEDRTRAGFFLVPDPRKPVSAIAELSGVGAATASAVLAAAHPDLYPFLDDLVGSSIPDIGKPAFSEPYYVRYAAALRDRAARLGPAWTPQAVGLALWADLGGKAGRREPPKDWIDADAGPGARDTADEPF